MERTYSGDHLLRSTGGSASAEADISDAIRAMETVPRKTAPPSVILVIGILQFLPCRSAPTRAVVVRPTAGDALFRSVYPVDRLVRSQIVDCLSTRRIVHCLQKPCVISGNVCIEFGGRPWPKQAISKPSRPVGTDPIGAASSEGASVYQLIREDIIEGRLAANERLVVADLARRHGTSTNPVREALQLLRGEGFVVFAPNRGARVRPIDQDFVRDIYEIGVLIEPALTRWFVNMATDEDIAELERIQGLIEENNFADPSGTASSIPPSTP